VFTEDKNSLAMRLAEGGQMLKFMSPEAEAIVKAVGVVISRWQNQQPVGDSTVYISIRYVHVHWAYSVSCIFCIRHILYQGIYCIRHILYQGIYCIRAYDWETIMTYVLCMGEHMVDQETTVHTLCK